MDRNRKQLAIYLENHRHELACRAIEQQRASTAQPREKHQQQACIDSAALHLMYLAEAVAADEPTLFQEYMNWSRSYHAARPTDDGPPACTLSPIRELLSRLLSTGEYAMVLPCLDAARDEPAHQAQDQPEALKQVADQYLNALLAGQRDKAAALIHRALDDGETISDIYLDVFQQTLCKVGQLWQINRLSVAEEHFCTAATQTIMAELYPRIFNPQRRDRRLVAACIGQELHEVGLRIVADFFEMDGWDTFHLGANVDPAALVTALEEHGAAVLALSATMTYHVRGVAATIDHIRQSAVGRDVKILVGGYPFNIAPTLWQKVGADGWAPRAPEAVALANNLMHPGNEVAA